MTPGEQRPSRRLLERQREAAERLRREVMGVDGSLDEPYLRALDRQLRAEGATASRDELVAAAARSGIVYVGDFHAVAGCQLFAAELLEELVARGVELSLGVEFIFARQQRLLERRQAGQLSDPDFLRRMHYRDEWGYPWEGYASLLERARRLDVPVYALDAPPRGGFDGIERRDRHAARRIASIVRAEPHRSMLVLFGESHLARSHLPRHVTAALRRAGLEIRQTTVFQNPDRIWWRRVSEGLPPQATVRLDDATWAVLHTNPLEKYEAYRQLLERWREDVPHDEEIDLTPAVHHLIGVLCNWLGLRAERQRVSHRAGWSEELIDAYPEVYSGGEAAELLDPILREHGRTDEEIEEAAGRLRRRGALYDSRANTLFLVRYLPGAAAGEGARFLRAALTGRLFIAADDFADDPVPSAYAAAYAEALACLGSRLVDPASEYAIPSPQSRAAEAGSAERLRETRETREWLERHRTFEESGATRLPAELIEPLRRSRPLRRALAGDLGRRVGRALFERVRRGELGSGGLRRLFARPLRPGSAARQVLQLLG